MTRNRVLREDPKSLPLAHMSCGGRKWTEPGFCATVLVDGRAVAVLGNASLLCMPKGTAGSDNWPVQAKDATDEQILAAVLGDE